MSTTCVVTSSAVWVWESRSPSPASFFSVERNSAGGTRRVIVAELSEGMPGTLDDSSENTTPSTAPVRDSTLFAAVVTFFTRTEIWPR